MKQAPDRSIVGEFEDVSLGDKRLERRLGVIAQANESAPGDSLVEQAGDIAALEATYRFLSNERVRPEAIFEGHAAKTATRAQEHDSVLVIHDTTEFRFGGAKERKGLGRVSTKKRDGFLAHYSLCLAPDGEPLGTWSCGPGVTSTRTRGRRRPGPSGTRIGNRCAGSIPPSARRSACSAVAHPSTSWTAKAISLSYSLRSWPRNNDSGVRLGRDRRLKKGRGRDGHPKLNEVLGSGPARFTRRVQLGRREREVATKKQKIFPEREPRSALLEIRAKAIHLHRAHRHAEHLPDSVLLNFVEAKEVGAPAGTTSVVWRLVTTEPIATEHQVAEVIDMYRKRWVVEEFFKAIKTGCRFESHQLEDIKGLLLALVIESAIAWQILRLRHVARSQPSAPGRNLLTRPQFETLNRLRALRGQPTDNLSVQHVIDELARLGVHLRNNGPPGWAMLKRVLRKLNLLAEGLCLADPAIPTEMSSIFRLCSMLTSGTRAIKL